MEEFLVSKKKMPVRDRKYYVLIAISSTIVLTLIATALVASLFLIKDAYIGRKHGSSETNQNENEKTSDERTSTSTRFIFDNEFLDVPGRKVTPSSRLSSRPNLPQASRIEIMQLFKKLQLRGYKVQDILEELAIEIEARDNDSNILNRARKLDPISLEELRKYSSEIQLDRGDLDEESLDTPFKSVLLTIRSTSDSVSRRAKSASLSEKHRKTKNTTKKVLRDYEQYDGPVFLSDVFKRNSSKQRRVIT